MIQAITANRASPATVGSSGAHPDPVRTLKDSAEELGALLEAAGDRAGSVPEELWREIAEAAVRVAAAAQMLAGSAEGDDSN